MDKNTNPETQASLPKPKSSTIATQEARVMSLEKARKLIKKTSAEHAELFRRLAK